MYSSQQINCGSIGDIIIRPKRCLEMADIMIDIDELLFRGGWKLQDNILQIS